MCQISKVHSALQELPKCEHHLHIEGTLSPNLLFRLAEANNIALPSATDPAFASVEALTARYERFTSLDDFLHCYYIGMSALITESDFELLCYEYFTRAHADGVVHAEISFDPQAHTSRGIDYSTVVGGLKAAQARAEKNFGITSKLIICFLRHLPVTDAERAYGAAEALGHFSDGTLAGIGLDSSEIGFPPELFRSIYSAAEKSNIHRTAHAGEEGDSTYIERALSECQVERIDHGIRLVDDETLLRKVASEKTLVTVCPISNVQLKCVQELRQLPIDKFLSAGVRFSINSDDPAYFGGYILDNYCAVRDAFHLLLADWKKIAEGAIEGSWCSASRKEEVLENIQEWAEKHKDMDTRP